MRNNKKENNTDFIETLGNLIKIVQNENLYKTLREHTEKLSLITWLFIENYDNFFAKPLIIDAQKEENHSEFIKKILEATTLGIEINTFQKNVEKMKKNNKKLESGIHNIKNLIPEIPSHNTALINNSFSTLEESINKFKEKLSEIQPTNVKDLDTFQKVFLENAKNSVTILENCNNIVETVHFAFLEESEEFAEYISIQLQYYLSAKRTAQELEEGLQIPRNDLNSNLQKALNTFQEKIEKLTEGKAEINNEQKQRTANEIYVLGLQPASSIDYFDQNKNQTYNIETIISELEKSIPSEYNLSKEFNQFREEIHSEYSKYIENQIKFLQNFINTLQITRIPQCRDVIKRYETSIRLLKRIPSHLEVNNEEEERVQTHLKYLHQQKTDINNLIDVIKSTFQSTDEKLLSIHDEIDKFLSLLYTSKERLEESKKDIPIIYTAARLYDNMTKALELMSFELDSPLKPEKPKVIFSYLFGHIKKIELSLKMPIVQSGNNKLSDAEIERNNIIIAEINIANFERVQQNLSEIQEIFNEEAPSKYPLTGIYSKVIRKTHKIEIDRSSNKKPSELNAKDELWKKEEMNKRVSELSQVVLSISKTFRYSNS